MVPPGDGLEFHATPGFIRRVSTVKGLDAAIGAELKNRPNGGIKVAGDVREMTLSHNGSIYVVLFTRRGGSTGLTAVFNEAETQLLEKRKDYLKKLFGEGDAK